MRHGLICCAMRSESWKPMFGHCGKAVDPRVRLDGKKVNGQTVAVSHGQQTRLSMR